MSGPFSCQEAELILHGPFFSSPFVVNVQPQQPSTPTKSEFSGTYPEGGLSDALQIPARFRSFLWILVPFQWNLPAKFSLQPQNFVILVFSLEQSPEWTGTEWHWNAVTRMNTKNSQIRQVLHFQMKNNNKMRKKNRDGVVILLGICRKVTLDRVKINLSLSIMD
jgi:hypothetical protein